MSNNKNVEQTVLIVYQHLPHYRMGVFSELEQLDGYKFTFAAGSSSRDGNIPAIPYEKLKNTIRLGNLWLGNALWQRGLIGHLLGSKYDHVIFLGDAAYISTWVGTLFARLLGAKTYFWTTGWHRPNKLRFKRIIRKTFYKLPDQLMLYGEDGYRIGVESGFPAEKMQIIGNSLPTAPTSTYESNASLNDPRFFNNVPVSQGTRYVGAIVRLNAVKRLELLVGAVALLRSEGLDIRILLVGEGPAREDLSNLSEKLEVPLYMPGATYSYGDIEDAYRILDVTVLPELAGLTVIQSLEFGVPVVTVSDPNRQAPEFRAVKEGVTGALYAPGDTTSLAMAIKRCFVMLDESVTQVVADCNAEVERNWSPSSQVAKIRAVLEK